MEDTLINTQLEEMITIALPLKTVAESLKPHIKEYIDNYDFKSSVIEDHIDNYDFDSKVTDAIANNDLLDIDHKIEEFIDDYDFSDNIRDSIDIDDIVSQVQKNIEEPDGNDIAYNLLKSFNVNNTCATGELFTKAVSSIIDRYFSVGKPVDAINHESEITQAINANDKQFSLSTLFAVLQQKGFNSYMIASIVLHMEKFVNPENTKKEE